MTCSEVKRLLARYLALELGPPEEGDVRDHLSGCAACRAQTWAREPAMQVAWALAAEPPAEDERFVADVLAGIHQRRVERHLIRRRRSWLAAAAALLLVVTGTYLGVRESARTSGFVATTRSSVAAPARLDPSPVEVEGDNVRLYQLASPASGEVQVAFIVDPRLEL